MSVSPLPSITENIEFETTIKENGGVGPETQHSETFKDSTGLKENGVMRSETKYFKIHTVGENSVGLEENCVIRPETKHSENFNDSTGLKENGVMRSETKYFKIGENSVGLGENCVIRPETKHSENVNDSTGLKENGVSRLNTNHLKTVKNSVGLEQNGVARRQTNGSSTFSGRISMEKPVIFNKSETLVDNAADVSIKQEALNRRSSNPDNNVLNRKHLSSTKQTTKHTPAPWIQRFSKKEQESLLPRRSHFNCHDKALKDAGYTTDELERKKAERTERRKMIEAKLLEARSDVDNSGNKTMTNGEASLPEIVVFDPDELNDDGAKAKPIRGRKKADDLQKVEHKALTEYLKYVKENTTEYLEYLKGKQKSSENMPDSNLIKTAMLFQKGHHGLPYETPTIRAAHSLITRSADPGQWQQLNKDHTINLKRLGRKDSIISKLITEKEMELKIDSDEPKTEYEKVLFKAERWLKTVSTAQFMRARQQALKEVDEEDTDVTQWWIAMQKCNYIRRVNTSSFSE